MKVQKSMKNLPKQGSGLLSYSDSVLRLFYSRVSVIDSNIISSLDVTSLLTPEDPATDIQ